MSVGRRCDSDRLGSRRRRAGRAEAEVVAVVPGRRDHNDAGARDVRDRLDHRVRARVDRGRAARVVDDVHPVLDRLFERGDRLTRRRDVPGRGRDVEDAVVADPRVRRHAAQPRRRRMVAAARGSHAGAAGCDSRDVRPVERGSRVDRKPAPSGGAGREEAPCHDHLRRREGALSLGEAGRVAEAAGVERRVRLVDPVVDHGDLDAGARRSGRAGEGGRADHAGASVRLEVVANARIDARDRAERMEAGKAAHRQLNREAVEDDLEAVAESSGGEGGANGAGRRCLLRLDARKVGPGRRAGSVEPAGTERCEEPRPPRRCERREPERRDHSDAPGALRLRHPQRSLCDPRHGDVAERAVDGPECGRGGRCEGKRRDGNDEHELAAQAHRVAAL